MQQLYHIDEINIIVGEPLIVSAFDRCGLNLPTDSSDHHTCKVTVVTTPGQCGAATDPFVPCTGFTLTGVLNKDKQCASVGLNNLSQKQATPGPNTILTGNALIDFCWR